MIYADLAPSAGEHSSPLDYEYCALPAVSDHGARREVDDFGRTARQRAQPTATPASPWLRVLWNDAAEANSESCWGQLPEDIYDAMEDDGRRLQAQDVQTLGVAAMSSARPAAVAAIRTLGILAEDGHIDRDVALSLLRDTLAHDDELRRYYGARAIWQARLKDGVASLERLRVREQSKRVQRAVERALAALA